jgi:Domain of unknown function (DUF4407)
LRDNTFGSRIEALFTGLGGGHWRELDERHERSTYAIAGVVVLLDAVLAWLVAALVVGESTRWPTAATILVGLVFGVIVGAVIRAVASGPRPGRDGIVTRGVVAVVVGVVVGELAALMLFAGSIDRLLQEQAARNADSAPAVVAASADLDRMRGARTALDNAVEAARGHRDEALIVARCEYNPSPPCPQTRITGVPGAGPETRSSNELLADAQRELDAAFATRDQRAPGLDANIAAGQQALAQARQTVIANADRGFGARWVAMHEHVFASGGALALYLITIAFFALLSLLPLILLRWLGETTHDRRAAARAERDRAELEADTAIAVKRAQVRAAAETMWADQQLVQARLAVEAQTEIDREHHRRRVAESLPALSRAETQPEQPVQELAQLPAPVASSDAGESRAERGSSLIPVTRAAARWIRPFVPPVLARAIDTTAQPLRAARHMIEEVEEITYSFKRTHSVSVDTEEGPEQPRESAESAGGRAPGAVVVGSERASLDPGPEQEPLSGLTGGERRPELDDRDAPRELGGSDGPRELPPAD